MATQTHECIEELKVDRTAAELPGILEPVDCAESIFSGRVELPEDVEELYDCHRLTDQKAPDEQDSLDLREEIRDYLMPKDSWEVPDSYVEHTDCPEIVCAEAADDADEAQQVKARKRGGRRHKGHFMKRPMAMSEVIEELQHAELRENALRCLSGHLIERREQDAEFYRQAGFFLYYSCGTVAVLLQEIHAVYERLYAGDLKVRGSKRLSNVLTLLQSIAANDETRGEFVRASIPNYLVPFILSEYTEEVYENVRSISLSVIGVICQSRDKVIIKWALENDIIEVCFYAVEIGSELSKVISMTILESLLRVNEGLSAICEPHCDLLPRFIQICTDLVSVLAIVQGFSPRLLFLVVRCYILLCQNSRALDILRDELPEQLQDNTFYDLKRAFPLFRYLRHQLLLNTGKAKDYLPSATSPPSPLDSNFEKRNNPKKTFSKPATDDVTPVRPINLNKQDWCTSGRLVPTTG